jgi:hypothetical protein
MLEPVCIVVEHEQVDGDADEDLCGIRLGPDDLPSDRGAKIRTR